MSSNNDVIQNIGIQLIDIKKPQFIHDLLLPIYVYILRSIKLQIESYILGVTSAKKN
jgi:hypothetical protein